MKYRKLGNSGLKISEISIGAWLTYGDSVDDITTSEIIRTAINNGVNFIDLADVYGMGESEFVIGKVIKDFKRSNLVLSSKIFWPMSDNINDRGLSRKHIFESIDKSLKRLGTNYLDIYFCHRFDPETLLEEVIRAMDDLVHQGKILYWGTSMWTSEQIENACKLCKEFNAYMPKVEQPQYNMFMREIEQGLIQTVSKLGIGLTVFSPLAEGILTGKYNNEIPTGSRGSLSNRLYKFLTQDKIAKVRMLTDLAGEIGCSTAQIALAWILRRPEISSAITGATRKEQIEENIKASDVVLDDEVLLKIEKILK